MLSIWDLLEVERRADGEVAAHAIDLRRFCKIFILLLLRLHPNQILPNIRVFVGRQIVDNLRNMWLLIFSIIKAHQVWQPNRFAFVFWFLNELIHSLSTFDPLRNSFYHLRSRVVSLASCRFAAARVLSKNNFMPLDHPFNFCIHDFLRMILNGIHSLQMCMTRLWWHSE